MSSPFLAVRLRALQPLRCQSRGSFHTSTTTRASILFALSALSNSRETQHFNKISRLQRVEHSPPLKLIQTGEVDPWPLPTPTKKPAPQVLARGVITARSAASIWDEKALQVGRVLLVDEARRTSRLRRLLMRAKRRLARQEIRLEREKLAWQAERQKMRSDMRVAGVWILASIGTATALATWRFWPRTTQYPDSGELGRKIAAKAKASMPVPRIPRPESTHAIPAVALPSSSSVLKVSQTPLSTPAVATAPEPTTRKRSWSRLFWKQ